MYLYSIVGCDVKPYFVTWLYVAFAVCYNLTLVATFNLIWLQYIQVLVALFLSYFLMNIQLFWPDNVHGYACYSN